MPKKTFLRLPREKQQRILDAAAAEFIQYRDDYEKSSISRIAERADVGTGTMYKYFENKNDLFFYLFEQNRDLPRVQSEADTFYDYFQAEFRLEERLTETGKVLSDILLSNPALFQEMTFDDTTTEEYFEKIGPYLANDQKRRLIREEIDEDIAAYMYSSLEFIAYRYCLFRGLDYKTDEKVFSEMIKLFFFGLYKNDCMESAETGAEAAKPDETGETEETNQ